VKTILMAAVALLGTAGVLADEATIRRVVEEKLRSMMAETLERLEETSGDSESDGDGSGANG